MASLQIEVVDAPAPVAGKPAAPILITVKGEAVVELEPLVTTLQNIGAKRPPLVVLHLKDLSFISSLAMGVMLAFRRSVLAGGGKVKVAAMQPLVFDSFKRARLDKVFEIHETLAGAMST